MTSTMSHCWVRTLCAWVCKKCAKYHHIFAHLNAYPHNFMCVYNNGIIVDVIIASQRRSNVLHFTQHIPSLRVFWTAKTPNFRYDLRTWEDQCLQTMYKQLELFFGTISWSTITWNSFGWPLTRVSQLSLSIYSVLRENYSPFQLFRHKQLLDVEVSTRCPWIVIVNWLHSTNKHLHCLERVKEISLWFVNRSGCGCGCDL